MCGNYDWQEFKQACFDQLYSEIKLFKGDVFILRMVKRDFSAYSLSVYIGLVLSKMSI